MNLYAYVGNDPVNAADPSGRCGTGTRLENDAVGCRVLDGYVDTDTAATGRPVRNLATRSQSAAAATADESGMFHLAGLIWGDHDYTSGPNLICPAAWPCTEEMVASVYSQIRNGVPGNDSSGAIVSGRAYTVYAGICRSEGCALMSAGIV
jgi:hypothetical protein